MKNEIPLRKKRSISEMLNDSFAYFRFHFKPLIKANIRYSGPFFFAGIILQSLVSLLIFLTDISSSFMSTYLIIANILVFIGFSLQIPIVVAYQKISLSSPKSEIKTKDIYNSIKPFFFRYITSFILLTLFISLASFILVVPAIYFMIALSLVFFIIGVEGKNSWPALHRSMSLINNFWWKSFSFYFLMILIIIFIGITSYIPGMLLLIFYRVIPAFDNTGSSSIEFATFVLSITGSIGASVFYLLHALQICSVGINYFSIVEAKEEVFLKEKIASMEEKCID